MAVRCKRVRVPGHSKTVCVDTKTGKTVKRASGRLVCPKTWRGKKVHRSGKNTPNLTRGMCYVKTANGGRRFVKKIRRA